MTMKNKEVRQSIAMVILLTIGFMLIAGCSSSSGGYEGSAFYYQQPQFVFLVFMAHHRHLNKVVIVGQLQFFQC